MKYSTFMMPLLRPGRNIAATLQEDREAVILANRLGFSEAYVGEHVTDAAEIVTSSMIFLASLIAETTQIMLGTGTVNLPHTHRAALAANAAMLDHLLKGRFMLGISPGGLMSDAEVFGNFGNDRNAMFVDCIDTVLKIWASEPPYNIQGKFWNISVEKTMIPEIGQDFIMKPYQAPHPLLVGTAVATFFQRRDRDGQARLAADFGQLLDAGMSQDPLAEICPGSRGMHPSPRCRGTVQGTRAARIQIDQHHPGQRQDRLCDHSPRVRICQICRRLPCSLRIPLQQMV